jgi:hypothetical protein
VFRSKALACSFCGKGAAQVSKLVAGPNVYICDTCVAEASRIMSRPGDGAAPRTESRSFWTSLVDRFVRLAGRGRVQLRAAC